MSYVTEANVTVGRGTAVHLARVWGGEVTGYALCDGTGSKRVRVTKAEHATCKRCLKIVDSAEYAESKQLMNSRHEKEN